MCYQCDYKASNTTVLKRHITLKHKVITPEKLRGSAADCSLQTSPTHEVREEPDESSSELFLAPSIPKINVAPTSAQMWLQTFSPAQIFSRPTTTTSLFVTPAQDSFL